MATTAVADIADSAGQLTKIPLGRGYLVHKKVTLGTSWVAGTGTAITAESLGLSQIIGVMHPGVAMPAALTTALGIGHRISTDKKTVFFHTFRTGAALSTAFAEVTGDTFEFNAWFVGF